MAHSETIDPDEYVRLQEEYSEKHEEFMIKHLHRVWPSRIVFALAVFQFLIALAILGVDFPIIFMYAPRWQVFAGCWTFVFALITCITTVYTCRKTTWLKVKWAVAWNIICAIVAALLIAFDMVYLGNSYICIISTGCNYLYYTHSAAKSYYAGQVVLGIGLYITTFIFLIIFIKYGIGGSAIFDKIQKGIIVFGQSVLGANGSRSKSSVPKTGPGAMMIKKQGSTVMPIVPPVAGVGPRYAPPPPGMVPRFPPPPPGMIPRFPPPPPGMIPRYPPPPPGMLPRLPPGTMLRPPPSALH